MTEIFDPMPADNATAPEPAAVRKSLGRMLRAAGKHEKKQLAAMARAVEAGNVEKAKALQRIYMASFSARLLAVARANRGLKRKYRCAPSDIEGIAASLDLWRDSDELVNVSGEKKPNGEVRPIMSFRLRRRAMQTLAASAMKPFVKVDRRQHGTQNGGNAAATKRVADAIHAGFKFFIKLDIRKFYESVRPADLFDFVPLPQKVIASVICPPDVSRIVPVHVPNDMSATSLISASSRGLSQGSKASPIVADLIVAEIMKVVPPGAMIVNIADDFGVMARTKKEALAISLALISAVGRCPRGGLTLVMKTKIRRVADGFDFLGYDFRLRRGAFRCKPTAAKIQKFLAKARALMPRVIRAPHLGRAELRRLVQSWSSAFPLWQDSCRAFWPRFWVKELAARHFRGAYADVRNAMT